MKRIITLAFLLISCLSFAQTVQVTNLSLSIDSGSVLCTDRNKKAFWLRPSTNGYVLTMANNKPQWKPIAPFATNTWWSPQGNIGTVQATDFLGTRDNVGLSFRTNYTIRQTITNTGKVGIGTTTPSNLLTISGTDPLRLIGLTQGTVTDSVLVTKLGIVHRLPMGDVGNAWHLNGNIVGGNDSTKLGLIDRDSLRIYSGGQVVGFFDGTHITYAIGDNAAQGNTNAYITAIGSYAAQSNNGDNVDAIGFEAAINNSGSYIECMGTDAAAYNSGSYILAFGNGAAQQNIGSNVIALGSGVLQNNTRSNLAQIGNDSVTVNYAVHSSPIKLLGNANYQIPDFTGAGANVYDTYVFNVQMTASRTITLPDVATVMDGTVLYFKDFKGVNGSNKPRIFVKGNHDEDFDGTGTTNMDIVHQQDYLQIKWSATLNAWLVLNKN